MQQHTLPHGNLLLIVSTPIGNMVNMKYLIHPSEERKSWKPEQNKEKDIQGSSSATTSIMNSR